MTDTPETDAQTSIDEMGVESCDASFARRLERERDEARDILDKMLLSLDADRAMRHIESLQSERDQLRAINAELLKSLEDVLNDWQYGYLASKYECTSYDIARELLTKIKEEKS